MLRVHNALVQSSPLSSARGIEHEKHQPNQTIDLFERSPSRPGTQNGVPVGGTAEFPPKAVDLLVMSGVRKRLNLELKDALSDLDEAVAKAPNNWFALANQAACLARMGRWAEARRAAEKALWINPQSALADLVVEIVKDYWSNEYIFESLPRLAEKYPKSDAVLAANAVYYLGIQDIGTAAASAQCAMKINPQNWMAGDVLLATSGNPLSDLWSRDRDHTRRLLGVLALPLKCFGLSEAAEALRLAQP